jgi:hypothetical protein
MTQQVYNECVDFYAAQEEGKCPSFDVLVTNPPFSADHLERIVKFAFESNKPFALLMPAFVADKPWFWAHAKVST